MRGPYAEVFRDRAILTSLNTSVDEINDLMMPRLPTQERSYYSADTANDEEEPVHFPIEYLNSLKPKGMPSAVLRLRIGAPVMLLRNLNFEEGMCNGTRFVVERLLQRSIVGRILGGDCDGQLRVIPRLLIKSDDKDQSFTLFRNQIPVRPCFAMTIHKAQGQSLGTVGVDLRTPVFSHGLLYVALSRATSLGGLRVLLPPRERVTSNIVYHEVLQGV